MPEIIFFMLCHLLYLNFLIERADRHKITRKHCKEIVHYVPVLFIPYSVLRQVHSLLQSEFSKECGIMLSLSFSSIISFP